MRTLLATALFFLLSSFAVANYPGGYIYLVPGAKGFHSSDEFKIEFERKGSDKIVDYTISVYEKIKYNFYWNVKVIVNNKIVEEKGIFINAGSYNPGDVIENAIVFDNDPSFAWLTYGRIK